MTMTVAHNPQNPAAVAGCEEKLKKSRFIEQALANARLHPGRGRAGTGHDKCVGASGREAKGYLNVLLVASR